MEDEIKNVLGDKAQNWEDVDGWFYEKYGK